MKKQILRLFCAALAFTMTVGAFASCENENNESAANETKYTEACAMLENSNYAGAYAAFTALGDYKDSQKYLSRFIYLPSVVNYVLEDRSGVMTITLGSYNLPVRMLTKGTIEDQGPYTKDGWYTYDCKGNLMRQAMTYNGDFSAFDYTYDANNRMIKAEYSSEGVVSMVNDYVYDANGLLIKESSIVNGVIEYDYDNTYDANGNLIKSAFQREEGDYVYTYTYNDKGNLVNQRGEVPGYWYNIDYTCNDKGERTKEVCVEDGELSYTVDYTYENAGNCIKEECTYPDGAKDVFTREYDANGNVTVETLTWADGTVQSVTWQYVFTYITIDVPTATMDQIWGIFKIL